MKGGMQENPTSPNPVKQLIARHAPLQMYTFHTPSLGRTENPALIRAIAGDHQ